MEARLDRGDLWNPSDLSNRADHFKVIWDKLIEETKALKALEKITSNDGSLRPERLRVRYFKALIRAVLDYRRYHEHTAPDRGLALCMSLHPRLGKESPLYALDAAVVERIFFDQ